MTQFVGHAALTIVVLKNGTQKYVYGPSNGVSGDPYPDDAAEGERERHHARGFVGPEDQEFDPATKRWSKKGGSSARTAPAPPADEKPAGNASLEDWQAYATSKGMTEEELDGLTRDDLRDLYK